MQAHKLSIAEIYIIKLAGRWGVRVCSMLCSRLERNNDDNEGNEKKRKKRIEAAQEADERVHIHTAHSGTH